MNIWAQNALGLQQRTHTRRTKTLGIGTKKRTGNVFLLLVDRDGYNCIIRPSLTPCFLGPWSAGGSDVQFWIANFNTFGGNMNWNIHVTFPILAYSSKVSLNWRSAVSINIIFATIWSNLLQWSVSFHTLWINEHEATSRLDTQVPAIAIWTNASAVLTSAVWTNWSVPKNRLNRMGHCC